MPHLLHVSLRFTISLLSPSQLLRANLRTNHLRPSMHRNQNHYLLQNGALHLRSPYQKNDHRRQNRRLLQVRIGSKTGSMHQNGRTVFQRDLLQKRSRTSPNHTKSHEIRVRSRHENGQIPRASARPENRQSPTNGRLHSNRHQIPTRSLHLRGPEQENGLCR